MKKAIWAFVLVILATVSVMAFHSLKKEKPDEKRIVEIFEGKIDQPDLKGAIQLGNITYDRNCKGVGNGFLHCDAGIKTEKYGVINFDYTHNMKKNPCLIPGDKVLLKVKADQKALVIR